jgi:hypothetical protein
MGKDKIYRMSLFSNKIELTQYIDKVFETLNETALTNTINLHNEIEQDMSVFADGKMLVLSFKTSYQMQTFRRGVQ